MLRRAGVDFELLRYAHDPRSEAYGLEAAEALGLDVATVFKTLLAELDGATLAVALVPVAQRLDLKALAALAGARRAAMAEVARAEKATGYVAGGISPLGQRRHHPTFIDDSALALPRVHVSAGRRGLEVALAPADLLRLCTARSGRLAR